MKINVEKGRMLEASVHWIHFILRNTDIMTRINNAPLRLQRINDRTFSGTIFGVKVGLEILGDRLPSAKGEVDIVADVRMPFLFGRTHTVAHYRYQLIDEGTTMVDLRFTLETKGVIMGIYGFFLKQRINKYMNKILNDNKTAAILTANSDSSLAKILTEEQLARITEYRSNYEVIETKTSSGTVSLKEEKIPDDNQRIWDAELRELASLYEGFQGQANNLRNELSRIIKTRDAVATLLIARRMLEVIVTQLCEKVLNRPRGTEPLAAVIDKLDRVDFLPDYIFTSMQNLNRLSTYGAHPKEFSPRQVRESLMALCSIVEWYVSKGASICDADGNLDAKTSPSDSAREEYRHLCKGVWLDGVVNKREREMLEKKRIELGLTVEDAKKIEAECAPDEQSRQS